MPKVKAEAANAPSVREQAQQAKNKLDSSGHQDEGTRLYDQRAASSGSSTYEG